MQKRTDDYYDMKKDIMMDAKEFLSEEQLAVLSKALDDTVEKLNVNIYKK